jgi:hypothetical protein
MLHGGPSSRPEAGTATYFNHGEIFDALEIEESHLPTLRRQVRTRSCGASVLQEKMRERGNQNAKAAEKW